MMPLSFETIQKIALFFLVIFVAAAAFFVSYFVAWSIFAGGLIVLGNLWFSKEGMLHMAGAVTAASGMGAEQQKAVASGKRHGYLLKFWLRIVITGVVLFVLIRWQLVNIIGLLVGLSTIFVTTLALSFGVVVYYLIQQSQGRR